jgi:multidrug efflux system membrane fusion protein
MTPHLISRRDIRRGTSRAAIGVAAGVSAVAAVVGFAGLGPGRAPHAQTIQTDAAVPVVADTVKRGDVPIYITGLGTVQAYNSVVVKARVDGQIVKIDFAEGQDVQSGDVLAEIDPAPLAAAVAQAVATRLKDLAQLDNARRDLARAARLAASGNATLQQQDTARSLVAQLEATVKADEAAVEAAQVQLNYTRVRSPISGRAGVRNLDIGNIVHASDANGIVTVNQLHPIYVGFALPADTLPQLRSAMKSGKVEVDAVSRDGRQLASGRLAVIDNQISTATASISYKAVFDNFDDGLWPGQFVNIRVLSDTRHDAVTVPATAVLRGPEGTYAFVIGPDHRVAKSAVKVGWSNQDLAVIDEGLSLGQLLVTDGQYRIQAGTLVEVRAPATAARDQPAQVVGGGVGR